jgi:hypothetical protein
MNLWQVSVRWSGRAGSAPQPDSALPRLTAGTERSTLRGLVLLGFFLASAVYAQPVPKLNSIGREWYQRGTTNEIKLTGENLTGATNFVFSGDPGLAAALAEPAVPLVRIESTAGISATDGGNDKNLTLRLVVGNDAPLGLREIRAVTPNGISNPLSVSIGALPEIAETTPNNSTNQAQKIEWPAAISGRIQNSAEVDYYRFSAEKGQNLIFEVSAFRSGSPLDSSLALLNAEGKELARDEDSSGLDSLIEFKVPESGDYYLQLRDFRYEGGGNYQYRLLGGVLPYVTTVFPLGGRRGQAVEVELKGRNLENISKVRLQVAAQAPLGGQAIRAVTPAGISNPFAFDVTDLAEFNETEPNNATNNANAITPPVMINGRINGEKDTDLYKFKSDKDQRLIVEIMARRFNSPLDAVLMLSDGAGKMLQQNDDAEGADARIDFEFKKDQEYVLSIRDLLNRQGATFGYRLSLRPPSADFNVKFLPDTVRIRRGSHASVRCELSRIMGFNGDVRIAAVGLPRGVTGESLILTPSLPPAGLIELTAGADAPLGTFPIKLLVNARLNGRDVERTAEPLSGERTVKDAFLTVLEEPPFILEVSTLSAAVEQGQSAPVDLLVRRRSGFAGDVTVSAEGFSAGREPISRSFDVGAVTVKADANTARLELKARLDAETGTRLVLVKGEANVQGQTIATFSRAIPVTVGQVPFVLNSSLTKLSVTALPVSAQSPASEAAFIIRVERRAGFDGEIPLTLEGLPEGILSSVEKIPEKGSEANIKLTATEKAPVGTNINLTISGAGVFKDRTYRQKTGGITLTVSAPATEEAKVAAADAKRKRRAPRTNENALVNLRDLWSDELGRRGGGKSNEPAGQFFPRGRAHFQAQL